ncbi:Dimethylmenaquinone methyltransferase [Coriobacterium glomerans PW2]|uniref:Putative 4-hydroxy-4-methyl-2-oxoglutarate aldolase n=1 Tax=Coriobacterium glomerans (strain ATCC 49209 / DSM 20642 / JCM 10262 / PW2) TaxID=700015 RepID=F2NBC2_CORGP|nr:RraA family protein [Coriobacterium glomerans]AEB06658.1 Dimethylmenaquinone methyltransferase [Coriobacterium glomerans PW2]
MSVGNRVFKKICRPKPHFLAEFAQIPCANTADTMSRSCAVNPRIRLMSNPSISIVAGPALTVKTRAGDNLMIHAALEMIEPGDILVVGNEGDASRALMGEIMFTYARYMDVGAIVLDGPIRDVGAVRKMDFPIYATGSTPGGPYKEGPGEVNVPISCGNLAINPGDIMVCDPDGVIAIPFADAKNVLANARELSALDHSKVEAAAKGTAKRQWVGETLNSKNVEIIDARYDEQRD